MSHKLRIGYVVPQFPGQTHIFFWREVRALEAMGLDPESCLRAFCRRMLRRGIALAP